MKAWICRVAEGLPKALQPEGYSSTQTCSPPLHRLPCREDWVSFLTHHHSLSLDFSFVLLNARAEISENKGPALVLFEQSSA